MRPCPRCHTGTRGVNQFDEAWLDFDQDVLDELDAEIDAAVGFGSPSRPPRQVRANFVSCNPPSAAIAAITGPDPVGTIQAANTRAIELLDRVIDELQTARDSIRGGAAPASIRAGVRQALEERFHMNAVDRSIWTGTGSRTVRTLIRRLRGARQILADGSMKYTCLGGATVNLRGCRTSSCDEDTLALACGGNSRIVLCAPWWSDELDDQAGTLLHEAIHIYFGFTRRDTGNIANAHCYEQFVLDINGLDVQAGFAGSCP